MEDVSQDHVVAVKNMTIKTFQEIVFYLLTLNCMSFMLCKPPFSLSSLISSTLQKLSETVKPCKDAMVCFHPQLFIAPYMFLFTISEGVWRPSCSKVKRECEFCANSGFPRYSCSSIKHEKPEVHRCKDDGFRNMLTKKERKVIERSKNDTKVALKRNNKTHNIPPQLLSDHDGGPDISKSSEGGTEKEVLLQKSAGWSIKKRYQDDKLAIQKAKEEIIRKKYERQKLCRSEIRLLGKKFLEKSLRQGMEIQQQLAIADRILGSAQNMQLPQSASANPIQSDTINLSTSPDQ